MATVQTNTTSSGISLGREYGVSGTIDIKGFIRQEEYNRNLVGREALKNYDIMGRSDGTVHAALQVCKLPIMAAHYKFKPASTDPLDQEIADFTNREFFNRKIDFQAANSEGLTCLDFGYAVGEVCYEPTTFNGQFRWGLQKLASRKQSSILHWQQSNGQPGIEQLTFGTSNTSITQPTLDIPMQKLYIFTNEKRGENYEGISLLRFAYKHWYIKDKLEMMNGVALERMGLGIPYVRPDPTSNQTFDPQALEELMTALRQIRVNEEAAMKIPAGIEVGFFDMKGQTTKDILPTIQYEDTQILLSVLAQFLGLGLNGRSGSRSLSGDQSQLFLRALEATAQTMSRGFQSIANRLVDLNYSSDKLVNGYPTLEVKDLDDDDVTSISTALQLLVSSGAMTPGLDVENRARRLVDIPEMTEEDYEAKQAEQQAQEDKKAQQAKDLADAQAKGQPANQLPAPKPGEQPQPADKPKPGDKAKMKADKLEAADRAVDDLFSALADELVGV